MKYRKKPVVIDAVQWFKMGDHPAVVPIVLQQYDYTQFPPRAITTRGANLFPHELNNPDVDQHTHGFIRTLESGHVVTPGDWIITGVAGEVYACKPDIFAATYEPVEE